MRRFGVSPLTFMMSLELRRVAVACGLMLCARAFAQPAPNEAEQLFQQARDLMAQKHFAEACPLLEKSHALEPALGALLNLADCYEQSGRLASAYLSFNEAAAWAARNHESKREEVAGKRAESLRPRLSLIALKLDVPVEHGEAQVWNPNAATATRTWSLEGAVQTIPLDPGPYELRVEVPGFAKHVAAIEVRATPGVLEIPVALVAVSPPPPVPPMVDSAALPPSQPAGVLGSAPPPGVSKPGVAMLVAGAVVLVAGGAGLAYSESVFLPVNAQQPGQPNAANPTITRAQFNTVRVIYPAAWAAVGVGAAVAAVGVVFVVRGVGVSVAPNGIAMRGSF